MPIFPTSDVAKYGIITNQDRTIFRPKRGLLAKMSASRTAKSPEGLSGAQ
jgi:hypothetical protein